MLFVFQVDTGRMMTFDMSLALESVENLKAHIETASDIPVDQQVLLISGGECMQPESRVCSYPAGTDTNPFFLFNKAIQEPVVPQTAFLIRPEPANISVPPDKWILKARELTRLPPAYATVQIRTHLAEQFHEEALDIIKNCEELVHEQHMQQQGWSAVVANLEDLNRDLKHRWERYEETFKQYVLERDMYIEAITKFKDDLLLLQKIPVLPALLQSLVPESGAGASNELDSVSLFDYISQKDDFMDSLHDFCIRGLLMNDDKKFMDLKSIVEKHIDSTESGLMKEIKGLEERLSGLECLMRDARKFVKDQKNLANSFISNAARANQQRDITILPDLCATHEQQMEVMIHNHLELLDISQRCERAKKELCENLQHRLRWVMYMEGQLSEADNTVVFSFENLSSLKMHLNVLHQVHTAPAMYLSAVAEVVRRRIFSQAFLLWASDVACRLLTIHNEELTRRKDFQAQFEGHFLCSLFTGLEDLPPSFATQAPSIFDSNLPKLSVEDFEKLKNYLPDLMENFCLPDYSSITSFFMLKDSKDDIDKNEGKAVEEKLMDVVNEAGLASNLDQNLLKAIETDTPAATTAHGLPHLKDLDKGCESETDTEEFEKVGQSPFELHFDKGIPSPRPGTQDASTLTEVGERSPLPPKKPPRTFQKPHIQTTQDDTNVISSSLQRTLSISGSQSNTESFTNIKNPSLESIDELSSLKNFSSNTESCFNSHHQQMQGFNTSALLLRSKSISPHTPQSPKDIQVESPNSPVMGHQHNDFVNDEFYIDESLPSSLSIETGQSQGEFVKQLDTANNVVALLQDNLQISRSEYEKLRSVLIKVSQMAGQALNQFKNELNELKLRLVQEKTVLQEQCENVTSNFSKIIVDRDNKEREKIHRIILDHELEINDFRKIAQLKNEEIIGLKEANVSLRTTLDDRHRDFMKINTKLSTQTKEYEETFEKLHQVIYDLHADKDQSVKEVTERLKSEHRSEIENIRARFKLMTMEKSPSENSLEKIERGEYSSLTNHEAILVSMTENFEFEKEAAVNNAVEKENRKWKNIYDNTVEDMNQKFSKEKDVMEAVHQLTTQDKDRQIEVLTEQIRKLSLECSKYRSTVHQLTESEEANRAELLKRIEELEKEKASAEAEFEKYKMRSSTMSMASSVAICEGKVDVATSPARIKKRSDSSIKSGKVSIDSCKPGDLVFVVWDGVFQNFRILQDNTAMFFLHSDCLDILDLKIVNGQPNKTLFYAEVVEKEYCHARKVEHLSVVFQPVNRFRVPQGTKFFRVKVKASNGPSSSIHQSHMSQSQRTASPAKEIVSELPSRSLPSSPTNLDSGSWEKSEIAQNSSIPEEKGEDSASSEVNEDLGRSDVEKGTELTENFNVELQTSIDR